MGHLISLRLCVYQVVVYLHLINRFNVCVVHSKCVLLDDVKAKYI